ncbi:hypothetical protein [Mucilaginibacter sp. 10I4]|uniref:hypothetical protein n=1 Tax=Mucilaginibacter sp. 10I4 TaxID=3048580 RepID=UPI002B234AB7|nr:hypothetical protein [Mucilaginibacter sp. 10I4]MEB0262911.1 hypothetical protein [Mucilaginibacter sp. 10I4]
MIAKEFVLSKYPKAYSYGMIDNPRRQTSTVIIKSDTGLEIFPNEGATNSSKAWTNAKKAILNGDN